MRIDRRTADGRHRPRLNNKKTSMLERGLIVRKNLTKRMIEVWSMLAWGLSVKEISQALRLSPKTIEGLKYDTMVYFKIYDWDVAFLTRLAVAFGLVDTQKPIK